MRSGSTHQLRSDAVALAASHDTGGLARAIGPSLPGQWPHLGNGCDTCPHARSGRSVRLLVADQLLERGFVADRIQVGVVPCGSAKLL